MNLQQYSILSSVGVLALLAITLVIIAGILLSKDFSGRVFSLSYYRFMEAIGIVAAASTFGALIFQLVYDTEVCILCWWQRVWMFPILIIVPVALYYKSKISHVMVLISSALGLFFAGYHYYYHFQGFVLGNMLSLPCSTYGLLPSCTNTPILIFGFITIPFMAMISFFSILVISIIAHKKFLLDEKAGK